MTCIVPSLLHSFESAYLPAAARNKLDGFHARCLRKILGIASAFINRVSNKFVLQQFGSQSLSCILLERQLNFFGHIINLPADSPQRKLIFEADSCRLKEHKLKRGRPRQTWSKHLLYHTMKIAGNKTAWKAHVRKYCKQL